LLGAGWLKKLSSSAERPLLSLSLLSGEGEALTAEGAAGGALRKLLKISSPPEVLAPLAAEDVPTGVSEMGQKELQSISINHSIGGGGNFLLYKFTWCRRNHIRV
jgi:hypothetical protein